MIIVYKYILYNMHIMHMFYADEYTFQYHMHSFILCPSQTTKLQQFWNISGDLSDLSIGQNLQKIAIHDDVIKWKHFPRYWPFVHGIHRSSESSPHKGHWHGTLMFSLICAWTNSWVSNRDAGVLTRHRSHYDVIIMNALQLYRWIWLRCLTKCVLTPFGVGVTHILWVTPTPNGVRTGRQRVWEPRA